MAIVGRTGSGTVESHSSAAGIVPGGQLVPGEVTVAVLGTLPEASTAVGGNGVAGLVTMLNVMSSPAAGVAAVQVTTTSAASAVQPSGDDANVSPAESGSVTTMLVASTGPLLVTVSAY